MNQLTIHFKLFSSPAMKAWNVIFKIFGVTPIVRDGHNLLSDKPLVIVSNHQSSFDLIGIMTIIMVLFKNVPHSCMCAPWRAGGCSAPRSARQGAHKQL